MKQRLAHLFRTFCKLVVAPSSTYVIIRYVTYAMQFANAILLARYLNEFYFGVYSFIMLVMQYMSYSNLGINESLNTEYAARKNDAGQLKAIWDNAWTVNILLNVFITFGGGLLLFFTDDLFPDYRFNDYKYMLLAICITVNLSRIYITYYKLWGRLYKLNIQQILPNLAIFLLLVVYRDRISINEIVVALFVSNAFSLLIFRIGVPVAPRFAIKRSLVSVLIRRGITLLLYNLSFYFLTVLASSLVSLYYSVEVFGCYSFANTLVNGVVMAGGGFLFFFFPKILNRLNTGNAEAAVLIRRIREVYVVFMDLISLLSVLFIIATTVVVPQYGVQMVIVYSILILGRIINNASTGYAALLIARGKERYLVIYGFLSILAVAVCGVCAHYLKLPVEYMALSVSIASFVYTYLVIRLALSDLGNPSSVRSILCDIFGMNKWLACLIIVLNAFVMHSYIVLLGCILLYCFVNIRNIRRAVTSGMQIVSDKNALIF